MQPRGEVKKKTNMSTCNRYLDSAQHVDLHLHRGLKSYVSPRYVTDRVFLSSLTAEFLQPSGWLVWGDTHFCLCYYGLDFTPQPSDFWRKVDFITTSDVLKRRRTLGNALHSRGNCTDEKRRRASFGHVSLGAMSVISTSACPQTTAWGTTRTSSRLFCSTRVEEGGHLWTDDIFTWACPGSRTWSIL